MAAPGPPVPLIAELAGIDAETLCARLRWPGGQPDACPRCGSGRLSAAGGQQATRWRCRACRRYFSVTDGTVLQGTRIGLESWVRAAKSWWTPGQIRQHLGVSYPTARRMARLLERTHSPHGNGRLVELLRLPAGSTGRAPGPVYGSPAAHEAWSPRFHGMDRLPRRHSQAIQALASLTRGATAARIAEYTGMSPGHARRCMRSLESRGLVRRDRRAVLCGYGMRDLNVWSFANRDIQMAAMSLPVLRPAPQPPPESIPAAFWWAMWSGRTADRINLRDEDDCLAAAARLVACPDPAAKNWALTHLPARIIRRLRTIRGYDHGRLARSIDGALDARSPGNEDADD